MGNGHVDLPGPFGYEAKQLNLKLKTGPKQLLGYLPFAFVLPVKIYFCFVSILTIIYITSFLSYFHFDHNYKQYFLFNYLSLVITSILFNVSQYQKLEKCCYDAMQPSLGIKLNAHSSLML
jgi:hypothetical protein